MENRTKVRLSPQLALGVIVILLGIVFTLDNLNLVEAGEYLKYWPALLVAFGLYRLIDPGDPPNYFPGVLFAGIGMVLLWNALRLHLSIDRYWPLLIVFLGLMIISHAYDRTRGISADSKSVISAFALLGGVQRTCRSQSFRGGELTAIMGACEIDLRTAAMQAEEAVINTFSFWGGIEIRVPESWTVTTQIFPLMGGCDDHTEVHGDGPRKHLVVKGLAVMGSVEVRN
ncbi:MAG: cell wall-active antibiotics response protein [Acidobacteriia bacterium]|nr:cell wall-active antibiotics response protein [Terriglobia bacterium]